MPRAKKPKKQERKNPFTDFKINAVLDAKPTPLNLKIGAIELNSGDTGEILFYQNQTKNQINIDRGQFDGDRNTRIKPECFLEFAEMGLMNFELAVILSKLGNTQDHIVTPHFSDNGRKKTSVLRLIKKLQAAEFISPADELCPMQRDAQFFCNPEKIWSFNRLKKQSEFAEARWAARVAEAEAPASEAIETARSVQPSHQLDQPERPNLAAMHGVTDGCQM